MHENHHVGLQDDRVVAVDHGPVHPRRRVEGAQAIAASVQLVVDKTGEVQAN